MRSDAQAEAASEADRAFSRMGMHKMRNDAQGEFSLRSFPCIFPHGGQKTKLLFRYLRAPRLNINPCVGSTLRQRSDGKPWVGDFLKLFESHAVGGLVRVTFQLNQSRCLPGNLNAMIKIMVCRWLRLHPSAVDRRAYGERPVAFHVERNRCRGQSILLIVPIQFWRLMGQPRRCRKQHNVVAISGRCCGFKRQMK